MLQYILKRILLMVPTLIGITIVTFLIIKLAPGDPSKQFSQSGGQVAQKSQQVASENIEEFRRIYGLDRPLHEQYFIWTKKLITFDFGRSITYQGKKVSDLLLDRLSVTMQMSIISVLLIYLISVPLGVLLSVKQNTTQERVITIFLFLLYSLPSFFVAILCLQFFANNEYYSIFPTRGFQSPDLPVDASTWLVIKDRLHHLFLPVIVYAIGSFAYLSMQMRGNMLEVLRQDYVRTARAKGLQERVVIFKHAMRNSLIPILTIFSSVLPMLIGGSVIVEMVFQVDGMGKFGFEAILQRDYNVIMATSILSAVLTLIGILISDILYVVVDPRISFD
jgi:peptide/nickel transport system permease protein